ncbi:unnamed protein product [Gongylonema pulchrum]|uniref:PDEase domain-containing protein n=1 Tax=Gongylonema pulchrum TaxID=637853 RepID=A0A183D6V1_9BILA|nr:unnamed protein product [Gongylonema pulchrum]
MACNPTAAPIDGPIKRQSWANGQLEPSQFNRVNNFHSLVLISVSLYECLRLFRDVMASNPTAAPIDGPIKRQSWANGQLEPSQFNRG